MARKSGRSTAGCSPGPTVAARDAQHSGQSPHRSTTVQQLSGGCCAAQALNTSGQSAPVATSCWLK